jgi:hypothetical protein
LRSGVLVTRQVAVLVVVTVQLAASMNGTDGMLSTKFRLPLVEKDRLIVRVLEKIIPPVVLFTAVMVTVALRVLAVVSIVTVPEIVTVTPSKLMVLLKEVV